MEYTVAQATEILKRTPKVLRSLLSGLSDGWIFANEGADTWSAFDVIGHLVEGEKVDWILRAEIMLSDEDDKRFPPFQSMEVK